MFLHFPYSITPTTQDLALIANTILLIVFLIIVEHTFTEKPIKKQVRLRYLYPIIIVLFGVLIFAAYHQGITR